MWNLILNIIGVLPIVIIVGLVVCISLIVMGLLACVAWATFYEKSFSYLISNKKQLDAKYF